MHNTKEVLTGVVPVYFSYKPETLMDCNGDKQIDIWKTV